MSAHPSARTTALHLDQAARSCEEAAHLASIAPQRARAWAEQLIRSGGSLPVQDPLAAERNPTAEHPRPDDNADQKTIKLDIGRPEVEPHIDGSGSGDVEADDVLKLSTTNRDHLPTLDAPPPNSSILVDEKFLYRTDHGGRVISAHAVLDRIDLQHPRDAAAQRRLAGKLMGDHAGHIFARIFGGPIGTMNLVPMKGSEVNLSQYKVIENHWRRLVDQGEAIDVSVRFNYADDAVRPHKIRVRYEHADGIVRRTIDNSPHRGAN
jgi:hypothetical protein